MDNLKELIGVITKHKLKGLEPIGPNLPVKNKMGLLFKGIEENLYLSEKQAIKALYKDQKNARQNFQKLKSRLEERLLATIFFIDINKSTHNDIQIAYYSCHKEWAAVKILIGKGARLTGIPLAEKLLLKAEKFEFSGVVLDVSRLLRFHYATINPNHQKQHKYDLLVKKHLQILNAEILAEEYYTIISRELKDPTLSRNDLAQKAKKFADDLKKKISNLNSYRLNLFSRSVYVYQYQASNSYAKIIEECESAIHFFESKPHMASKTSIFTFSFKILACCIQLRRFAKGEKIAQKCFELASEGNPNWFDAHELYITLCLHTRRFQDAYIAYSTAAKHKKFKYLYSKSTENWKIYEAYINYFISNETIELPPEQQAKKFRIRKFLNEVPRYSKDKRGKNIPILVIHILFLLQQKKYGVVIDRVEAINQYNYRYLRKDDTFRSNCFIKMLLQLPKGNFHKQAVLRKAARYEKKLKEMPLEVSGQFDEIEIVPYEILWEYVVESLDNKFH